MCPAPFLSWHAPFPAEPCPITSPSALPECLTILRSASYLRIMLVQEQVRVMTEKHHVYLTQDGRISMAGLSSSKCRYLAEAINDAVRNA